MGRGLFIGLLAGVAAVLVAGGPAHAGHSGATCSTCHVPHHAKLPSEGATVPLWSNVGLPTELEPFTLYSSKTLKAVMKQPDGSTKMCLACHDGTYDYVADQNYKFYPAEGLARSHPVSFVYDGALVALKPTLNNPTATQSGFGGTIDTDLLDVNHEMQCTTCHDVHMSGIGPNHLRYAWDPAAGTDANMCKVCHNK